MKFNISQTWCETTDELEQGVVIGAGALALNPGPRASSAEPQLVADERRIAFCQFVTLSRRGRGMSVEDLAAAADVDLAELVAIEQHDAHYAVDARSVYQLANFFAVSRPRMMALAGLTNPKNSAFVQEALKFAARSVSVEKLNDSERAVLEGLVTVLTERSDP